MANARERSTASALDIRGFLDGLIFTVLIGNADAHGKSYSIKTITPADWRKMAQEAHDSPHGDAQTADARLLSHDLRIERYPTATDRCHATTIRDG